MAKTQAGRADSAWNPPVSAGKAKSAEQSPIINQVFLPGHSVPLTPEQLAKEAGHNFKPSDFSTRLAGRQCACLSGGQFTLLPENHPDVVQGGKRYMKCRVCGEYSHL